MLLGYQFVNFNALRDTLIEFCGWVFRCQVLRYENRVPMTVTRTDSGGIRCSMPSLFQLASPAGKSLAFLVSIAIALVSIMAYFRGVLMP